MDRKSLESTNAVVSSRTLDARRRRPGWVALWAVLCGVVLATGTALAQEETETGAADKQQANDKAQDASQQAPQAKPPGQEDAEREPGPPRRDKKGTTESQSTGTATDRKVRDRRAATRGPRKPIPTQTPKGPVTGAPGIRCDQTVKDFGVLWSGPAAQHTFRVRNEGDQALEIQSVRPSCGCTVTKNYTRRIAPGGEGSIPVSLSTTKVRGKFGKGITVQSNDPVTPQLRLKIEGEVKRYVDMTPSRLNFRDVSADTQTTLVATLTNNTETPLELSLPASTTEGPFTLELAEKEAGQVYQVKVHAKPPYKPRLNRATFTIGTNLIKQPKIDVSVTAHLRPRLYLDPEHVSFRKAGSGEQSRTLKFINSGGRRVKVLSAQSNDEHLHINVLEQLEGKRYNIRVTVPANYLPPAEGKTITVKTDDPEIPELTALVKGRRPKVGRTPAVNLVGNPAPSFEFETFDDKTVTAKELEGKVVLLDFYASWCGFCKKQVPKVTELYKQKYADNPDVQFLAVSQDRIRTPDDTRTGKRARTREEIAEVYQEIGGAFPAVLDPERLGPQRFLVREPPTVVLLGKDGVVEAVHFRDEADLTTQLEKQIDLLLVGKTRADFPPDAPATPAAAVSKSGSASGATVTTE